MKKTMKPVADPVRDAEERNGGTFVRKKTVCRWEPWITRCTTGQFARLDGGYRRHCGPTAITNLILTLYNRNESPEKTGDLVPAEVFSEVSRIGQKKKIYWNTDILGRFGGTYDVLTEWYIRACLKCFSIPIGKKTDDRNGAVSLRWRGFPSETQFLRELDAGKLLYLQLYRHPCYGTHHLLCYGYTVLYGTDAEGKKQREIYLIVADGWSRRPRYLQLKSRGICHFFSVG